MGFLAKVTFEILGRRRKWASMTKFSVLVNLLFVSYEQPQMLIRFCNKIKYDWSPYQIRTGRVLVSCCTSLCCILNPTAPLHARLTHCWRSSCWNQFLYWWVDLDPIYPSDSLSLFGLSSTVVCTWAVHSHPRAPRELLPLKSLQVRR